MFPARIREAGRDAERYQAVQLRVAEQYVERLGLVAKNNGTAIVLIQSVAEDGWR